MIWAGALLAVAGAIGCAEVPPCQTSPVAIEETRESVKILEKDLVGARDRAKKLSADLAAKQAEYNSKKDKPDELREEIEEREKGSGRHESQEKKEKDKDKDDEEKESA